VAGHGEGDHGGDGGMAAMGMARMTAFSDAGRCEQVRRVRKVEAKPRPGGI
jgi:hypothetical protein